MPQKEVSIMSQRKELVTLAQAEGANIGELCRSFGVSPNTAYKWLSRYSVGGGVSFLDLSRRPHTSPARTPPEVEGAVLSMRDAHAAWGGRKLRRRLIDLAHTAFSTPSTITAILKRHGRINVAQADKHKAWKRFEREAPNHLWQMDFKGHFPLTTQGRCHPLTVLDDHSRYALGVEACGNERDGTVKERLTAIFRCY